MKFDLTILGSSSATPTRDRYPTAQLLNIQEHYFLVDCGEGTQMRFKSLGIKFYKLNHIFISHLHGDHYFGLIGLISTMHLFGRTEPLNLYGPPELKEIIDIQLKASCTELNYQINFFPLKENFLIKICETKNVDVFAFPLKHRIPTWGFKFVEKQKLKNIKEGMIDAYKLSIAQIKLAKEGANVVLENGTVLLNSYLTTSNFNPMSYAFCSDTIFDESIVPYLENISVLYHEATFLSDLETVAAEKFHSTAKQAASIAKYANVKMLIIGHFSARYDDLSPLLNESKLVFENTLIAEDCKTYKFRDV